MPLDKILSPEMAKLLGVEVGEEIPKSQVTVLAYVKSHNLFGPGEKDFTLDDMLEPLFGPQTRQPVARVWDHHQTSQSIGIPTTEMEEGSLGAVLENLDTVEYGRSGRRRPHRSPLGTGYPPCRCGSCSSPALRWLSVQRSSLTSSQRQHASLKSWLAAATIGEVFSALINFWEQVRGVGCFGSYLNFTLL